MSDPAIKRSAGAASRETAVPLAVRTWGILCLPLRILRLVNLHLTLRLQGATYGKGLRGNRARILNCGAISLGDEVLLNSFPEGELFRTGLLTESAGARITIGSRCRLNGTMVYCRQSVAIGNDCIFGPGTVIVDNDSHRVSRDVRERQELPKCAPVVIRDNVWLGMGVLVLKGVTIGENSIVAARAVVTHDVPANCLAGGFPARVIRPLDPSPEDLGV